MTLGTIGLARVIASFIVLAGVTPAVALVSAPAFASVPAEDAAKEADRFAELAAIQVAGPFEYPWSIAFLPDRSILVTEKPGRLQVIRPGAEPISVAGVPAVLHKGHGGLLDVAVDPGFADNGIVYLSYAHGTEDLSSVRVMRAKLDRASNALTGQRVIFESTPSASTEQLGGRIAVTGDGHLFLTLGARWQAKRAQDLSDDAGKIVRIRVDGSVPKDNPYVSVPGARPEVWSYGHRNPQGLAFDATGRLWSHEHGPMGGDELNLIVGGRNYGWPVITYGRTYLSGEGIGEGTEKEGMEQPVRFWSPAIAPSGLAVEVDGDTTLVWMGALAGQSLVMLEIKERRITREQHWFQGELGRIRDVRIGPDSSLYLIVDDARAGLYRVEPAIEQAHNRRGRSFPGFRSRLR